MSLEIETLIQSIGHPPRHPDQIHKINESDCEIIRKNKNSYIVTTVDSISEEISLKLYQDPYTMGWVAAQASLSDLATTGCQPTGLLFSTQWSAKNNLPFKKRVFDGFNDALREHHTFLLGGDSGSSHETVLTSTGIGLTKHKPLTRLGTQNGDYLCITGKSGCGPALAFRLLRQDPIEHFDEINFRPSARLKKGRILQKFASAMIDTSDGILTSIYHLHRINNLGFKLFWNADILDPRAVKFCEDHNLPLWLLWVGEHGDFELLFTISPENFNLAKTKCLDIHIIGRATKENSVKFIFPNQNQKNYEDNNKSINVDFSQLCLTGEQVDIKEIYAKFLALSDTLRKDGLP